MKKLSLRLLSLFAAASLFAMTSCDSETDTVDPAPTATIASSTPTTAKVGDKVTIAAAVVAEAKIKTIVTRLDNADLDTKTDNFTNSTSDNYSYEYTVPETAAGKDLKFSIVVTDSKGAMVSTDHTVKVGAVGGEISTYSARLFGGQENTKAGSFFRSSDGKVLFQAEADAAPSSVDLIYLYSGTNGAVFTAPNDADVVIAHKSVTSWGTNRNATKIKSTTVTKDQFTSITNDVEIVAAAEGASATRVNDLKVGNVFAFITVGGKKGLVLVEEISGTTGTDRSIKVNVKIQKNAI